MPGKSFAIQCFFSDHFNHKIVNKTTCRKPSANSRQLWTLMLKSFRNILNKSINKCAVKSLKIKKKKLALFYYVGREIWLSNSKKLIYIDKSRFYIFSHPREFKNV